MEKVKKVKFHWGMCGMGGLHRYRSKCRRVLRLSSIRRGPLRKWQFKSNSASWYLTRMSSSSSCWSRIVTPTWTSWSSWRECRIFDRIEFAQSRTSCSLSTIKMRIALGQYSVLCVREKSLCQSIHYFACSINKREQSRNAFPKQRIHECQVQNCLHCLTESAFDTTDNPERSQVNHNQ